MLCTAKRSNHPHPRTDERQRYATARNGTQRQLNGNGTQIETFGKRNVALNLGVRRKFEWPFIIANVTRAIIGAEFLGYYELLVDLRERRLIDAQTELFIVAGVTTTSDEKISAVSNNEPFTALLHEFVDITRPLPPSDR